MDILTVASELDSLTNIAQYVKTLAQNANLDKKRMYKLRLAVDEIATNIILYSHKEKEQEAYLNIKGEINEQKLTIQIEDSGDYFDPREKISCETENIDKDIEERPIGKLGIYLAIDGVDEFIYERKNDKNYNTFIVNI